jgi:hypothetical protein
MAIDAKVIDKLLAEYEKPEDIMAHQQRSCENLL